MNNEKILTQLQDHVYELSNSRLTPFARCVELRIGRNASNAISLIDAFDTTADPERLNPITERTLIRLRESETLLEKYSDTVDKTGGDATGLGDVQPFMDALDSVLSAIEAFVKEFEFNHGFAPK